MVNVRFLPESWTIGTYLYCTCTSLPAFHVLWITNFVHTVCIWIQELRLRTH